MLGATRFTKISRICRAILLAPLLLVLAPLMLLWVIPQIPFSLVEHTRKRRREKSFAFEMQARQRLIPWPEARKRVDDEDGTFIQEFVSTKGPYRLWLTNEHVAALSPYPCRFSEAEASKRDEFISFDRWCRDRYTDPEKGGAQLVDIAKPHERDWSKYLIASGAGQRLVIFYGIN